MDTVSFFSKILPSEGFIVLAEFRNGAMKRHHFFSDIETAAEAVLTLDARGADVYHACATYKEDISRKQSNVHKVKAFWLDIDIGKAEELSYATKTEAKEHLVEFCRLTKIHPPTIVSSGRGLHCYWLFSEPVSGDVWKAGAQVFRQALDSVGFKHDPSRTTDQASILRPVGSTWRKDGEVPVKLLIDSAPEDFSWYLDKLNAFLGQQGVAPEAPKRKIYEMFAVETLGVKAEYPPSSAVRIAGMCAQVGRMRDFQGAISEPEWRNSIGVLKHTVEGDEVCHAWSQGDPRYDHDETQEKIDRWETGPTTCETFERTNSHVCAGCKFKGKIKSPIQLGYTEEVAAPEALEQPETVEKTTIDFSEYWPKGFRWDEDASRLLRLTKDKDGAPEWIQFCDTLFYPTTRIQLEDGTWAQRCRMRVSEGIWREFDIPTKHLASAEALCGTLASYEIVVNPRQGVHAVHYAHGWLEQYKRAGVEMQLYKHYGWDQQFSSFLIGDNLLMRDGSENKVILSDAISRRSLCGDGYAGSDTEWARLFNQCYNRPGAEVYQFTAMALLASPLVGLLNVDSWRGIPIGLTGPSGQGKTTVGKAACSAYGFGPAFVFDTKNATANAFDPFLGTMHNLPVVLDELTGKDPRAVSDKLFALSVGQGKDRANQKGELSAVKHRWACVSLITGNSNINEAMAQLSKHEADASQVRVFEYMFQGDMSHKIFGSDNIQDLVDNQMGVNHYGVVGRRALRVMMHDVSKIREAFFKLRERYGYASDRYDPKERFFIDLIVTAYMGGRIFKQLGYIDFDIENVRDWALNHIVDMRSMRSESSYSTEDRVAQFISSLNGHILVTKHFDRSVQESPLDGYPLRGEVKARMSLNARKLVVSYKAFEEWCKDAHIPVLAMRRELADEGFLVTGADNRQTITKGTTLPSGQQRVLEFVFDRVSGMPRQSEPAQVVAIHS